MTPYEYEHVVLQQWVDWCGQHARSLKEYQSLCANNALYTWWYREYREREREFYYKLPHESDTSKKGRYLLYLQCVTKVRGLFSRPLINNARKMSVVCK